MVRVLLTSSPFPFSCLNTVPLWASIISIPDDEPTSTKLWLFRSSSIKRADNGRLDPFNFAAVSPTTSFWVNNDGYWEVNPPPLKQKCVRKLTKRTTTRIDCSNRNKVVHRRCSSEQIRWLVQCQRRDSRWWYEGNICWSRTRTKQTKNIWRVAISPMKSDCISNTTILHKQGVPESTALFEWSQHAITLATWSSSLFCTSPYRPLNSGQQKYFDLLNVEIEMHSPRIRTASVLLSLVLLYLELNYQLWLLKTS